MREHEMAITVEGNAGMTKLTMPQAELLRDLAKRPEYVNDFYAPGKKLLALGYATRREGVFGEIELTITDAGHAALRAES